MSRDPVRFEVEPIAEAARQRLDAFLRARLGQVSRGAVQRLIESGHVRVNGEVSKPAAMPRAGDVIEVQWPEARPAEAQPQEIPLEILFEDEHLLVLNKAAGLVVHPAAGHDDGTLVNALLHHCAGRLSGIGGVARPGIVHRLDKDTTGCLVVAKDDVTHVALAAQFAGRDTTKTYQALVCGHVARDAGRIAAAIARHPSHRKRMAVSDGGRESLTEYRVLARLRGSTQVEVALHTGRTHQIRVHFQHLGHPVVGDEVYGERPSARLTEQTGYQPPRQLLHAWRLAFDHPHSGQRVTFEAPLPADFREALARLGGGEGPG